MTDTRAMNPDLLNARNAQLAENWWVLALRGLLAILFGIAAFAVPGPTMLALVIVFAAYALLDGILNIVLAVRGGRRHERWGLLLFNGLLGILIAALAVLWPVITVLVFVFMVAAWALMSGALMLGSAFSLKISHGRWLLAFMGVVSILYGLLLFVTPLIGAIVLTWWVGAYAMVMGGVLIYLAFKLREHRGEPLSGHFATSV